MIPINGIDNKPNDNVKSIWESDKLGRGAEANFLQNFVEHAIAQKREFKQVGSLVLNLNSGWGDGKTFFLNRLSSQLKASGHVSVYVDAWAADHLDDPLLPLLAGIDCEIKSRADSENGYLGPKATTAWDATKRNAAPLLGMVAKGAVKNLAKKVIGDGVDDVAALFKAEDGAGGATQVLEQRSLDGSENSLLSEAVAATMKGAGDATVAQADDLINKQIEDYQERINAKKSFAKSLSMLASTINGNDDNKLLVILLDEIDRCRPTFALEMLERIKHFFDVDGVVFIVATDTEQLEHSIRAVYGQGFDAGRYLHRFFEQTLRLAPAPMDQLIAVRGDWLTILDNIILPGQISYQLFVVKLAKALNLNARDIISVLERLRRFFLERKQPYGFAPSTAILVAFLQRGYDKGVIVSATDMTKVIAAFDSELMIVDGGYNGNSINVTTYCVGLLNSARANYNLLDSERRKESQLQFSDCEFVARRLVQKTTFDDVVKALTGLDRRWSFFGGADDL